MHLKLALSELMPSGLDWSRLESYTCALIRSGKHNAIDGKSKTINLPNAVDMFLQSSLGVVPEQFKSSKQPVLLKLCDGHPVIDHILYSSTTKTVYWLQTSKSHYSSHSKKITNLQDTFGLTKTCPQNLKEEKIEPYYLQEICGSLKKTYFVYATTSQRSTPEDVYKLTLSSSIFHRQ